MDISNGSSVDDKKYATDTSTFKDAVLQDGIFKNFEDSPVTDGMLVKDICVYKPGDLNKIGKEGKHHGIVFPTRSQNGSPMFGVHQCSPRSKQTI